MPLTRTLLTLSACAMFLLPGAVFAAEDDTSSTAGAEASQNEDTANPNVPARLNACFGVDSDYESQTAVLGLRLTYTESGEFQAMELTSPSGFLTGQDRALLTQAFAAVASCAPVDPALLPDASRQVALSVDSLGFSMAEPDAAPDVTAEPVVPVAPASPGVSGNAGTPETEVALGLDRTKRLEIQRRLTLIGYDTNGVDGVFGNGTRSALTRWQNEIGVPPNGYLTQAQIDQLAVQSAAKYAEWNLKPKNYYGRDGCLRRPSGKIILGRSVRCDLRAVTKIRR